jgi:hypothetical protein
MIHLLLLFIQFQLVRCAAIVGADLQPQSNGVYVYTMQFDDYIYWTQARLYCRAAFDVACLGFPRR